MLTVKHVERSGHESVTTAASAYYDPAVGQNNEYPKGQVVAFGSPNDGGATHEGVTRFGGGKVFIMNDHGSTVANYDLD